MMGIRLFQAIAAGRRERGLSHAVGLFILFMALTGGGVRVQAVESYPPLVPRGEKIQDIHDLVKNISRSSYVNSIAFSPDGQTLASYSLDGTIRLWETATGKPVKQMPANQ